MIITPYSAEIENISSAIENQTGRVITFTSAQEKEGVSTTVHSVTQRLLLSGYSVLLVDLNPNHPAIEKTLNIEGTPILSLNSPQLVSPRNEEFVFTGVTLTNDMASISRLRKPHALKEYFSSWKNKFDFILIDSPPILEKNEACIPAEHIAKASDATIIVTLAQHTTEASLVQAVRKLKENNITLLGLVLNDQKNPGLKNEIKRQIDKLKKIAPKKFSPYINILRKIIENNSFFSIET